MQVVRRRRAFVLALAGLLLPIVGLVAPQPASAEVGVLDNVVSGFYHSCALRVNQTVACWGRNNHGQIGDNSPPSDTAKAIVPVSVDGSAVGGLTSVVSIVAGENHTCALSANGTVACWGDNNSGPGQLGNGSNVDADAPVNVTGITNATAIAAGSRHTCALLQTGAVKCWGANNAGQLGDGTIVAKNTPVSVTGLTGVLEITAGTSHTCALKTDTTVVCWGANYQGQLGDGTLTDRLAPTAVPGLDRVAGLAAGFAHTCARKTNNSVWCWGNNDFGQIGMGNVDQSTIPDPQPVVGLTNATSIAAGYYHMCAVRSDKTVVCWGRNEKGQVGNGGVVEKQPGIQQVVGLTGAVAVGPGLTHTCAVLETGTVACWGDNQYGALGNNTIVDSAIPVTVSNLTAVKITPTTVTNPGSGPSNPLSFDQPFNNLPAPERLLDTRTGANDVVDHAAAYQGSGQIGTTPKSLQVTGRGSTPAGAASTVVNVTAVNPSGDGYITIYPCDQAQPSASSLNFAKGDVVPNAVVSKLSASGSVCIFSSVPTDVLVDASGYFPTTASFTPLANPRRLLETRPFAQPTIDNQASNIGQRAAGSTYRLQIGGRNNGEIPGSVASVVMNVTAIAPANSGEGYVTVFPCNQGQPRSSNVNYRSGQTIPNLVISKVSPADGQVCIFTSTALDLVVDAVGYFATTVSYTPLTNPARFVDTRPGAATDDGQNAGAGPQATGTTFKVTIGGRNGVSPTAGSVLLNVTAVAPGGDGYLTVYPCGTTQPQTSSLNFTAGHTIANSVAAGVGTNRQVCIYVATYNPGLATDLIIDVAGQLS